MPTTPRTILKRFADDGAIPNNPRLPVVILKGALPPDMTPEDIGALHRRNGWGGTWVYTVFDHHHWHPDAHEALSVARGSSMLSTQRATSSAASFVKVGQSNPGNAMRSPPPVSATSEGTIPPS